jgi:DNA-binding GntR family transcriptional regulator
MDERPQPSAQEHPYRYLREEILTGRLAGGARLKQEELARRFRISRMPVRDALLRLHAEGLVRIEPNRSVVVTRLAPVEVQELFEIRAVLEGLALRLALPNFTSEAHVEAEELVVRLERGVAELELWIRRHEEFHEYLNRWSGRPRLSAEIRQLRSAVQPYFRLFLRARGQPQVGVAEHRAILDVIKRGDARGAEEVMRRHVLTAAAGVVDFLSSQELGSDSKGDR